MIVSRAMRIATAVVLASAAAACDEGREDAAGPRCWGGPDEGEPCTPADPLRVDRVRTLLAAHDVAPIAAPPQAPAEQVALGRALFFDKILSGTKDVACATCHHPTLGGADGRPVFSGIHGEGLGLERTGGALGGRHSQHVFNLHLHRDLTVDGKVELRDGEYLVLGLPLIPAELSARFEYGVASAQAIMPIVTDIEMLGVGGENELAACAAGDLECVWDGVMARLGDIPEYVALFEAAYPGEDFAEMSIAHVGNAIAAFELRTFHYDDSPFDRFLAGDDCALSPLELRGAERFYDEDKANCVACHAGGAMTDQGYHRTATPQFGPGQSVPAGDGPGGLDDFGRMRNTGDPGDKYAWRTPPLRNVELTAPYGRLGQYATLEAMIARYKDVEDALVEYDITQLALPELWGTLLDNTEAVLATGVDPLLGSVEVKPKQVAELAAFLRALTDPATASLAEVVPASVPSGLPVDGV